MNSRNELKKDMSPEEAVEDAIETAKLQGGNLYFIIKKNVESDGRHLVLHLLDALLDQPDQVGHSNILEIVCSFGILRII